MVPTHGMAASAEVAVLRGESSASSSLSSGVEDSGGASPSWAVAGGSDALTDGGAAEAEIAARVDSASSSGSASSSNTSSRTAADGAPGGSGDSEEPLSSPPPPPTLPQLHRGEMGEVGEGEGLAQLRKLGRQLLQGWAEAGQGSTECGCVYVPGLKYN